MLLSLKVRTLEFCILVFIKFLYQVNSVPLEEFYPYGRENGDDRAPTNDDGSTDPIPVSSLFPFFNHQHDSLIVNTNGVISFLGTMSTYTPSQFPLATKRRLIAPYWADIDTRRGGDVWYRETFNSTYLHKASEEIHKLFPEYHNFQASWMFIATWEEVAFYGATNATQQEKRCTFQCLLVTNGRHSFTTYMYNKIEWTTGTASGGDYLGLGGTPAQVGFDAGDGFNYYALEASRTPKIINVTQMSNIDYPGKFIYRVDSTAIKEGGCNVEGTLTITPKVATMLGGTRLIVSGPCFDTAQTITLHLSDGKTVPCELFTDQSASCISPTLHRTGKDIVVLRIVRQNDTVSSFVGSITFVNHGLTKHVIKRTPSTWNNNTEVTVSWNANSIWTVFRNSFSKLELFEIKKRQDGQFTLEYHSNIATNVAQHLERTSFTFNLNFNGMVGIIKISSSESGPYFWSDIFTVNVSQQHSQSVCDEWRNGDGIKPEISLSDVTPCPCTLQVANIDISRFSIDPQCRNYNSERQCRFQPFARLCFKLNSPTSLGYDSQCCYNENGLLMNSDGFYLHGSGYANRYHYMGDNDDNIPYLSNFYHDIMPYQHCCLYQPDSHQGCTAFYDRRPPNSCLNYVPPRPARVSGDPHFVTFDGQRYTFNPVGEFTAISSGNFTLQLRMEQVGNLPASSVTSLVARTCPNSDPIEVRGNSIRGIDVIVNGSNDEINWSEHDVIVFNGAMIERTSDDPLTIVLRFPAEGISIKVISWTTTNRAVLNLLIFSLPGTKQGNMTGLFGDNDGNSTNDFKTNDNVLVSENASQSSIHHDFGSSWRITEESSLFTYDGGRDFSSYQNHDFQPMFDVPNITEEAIDTCGYNTDCLFDLSVTKDREFAMLSANASETFADVTDEVDNYEINNTNPTIISTTSTSATTSSRTSRSSITSTSALPTTLTMPTTLPQFSPSSLSTKTPTTPASRQTQILSKTVTSTSANVASFISIKETIATETQKPTQGMSSSEKLSDQNFPMRVVTTVLFLVLALGEIVIIIIGCVVLNRIHGLINQHNKKYDAKDLESISQLPSKSGDLAASSTPKDRTGLI